MGDPIDELAAAGVAKRAEGERRRADAAAAYAGRELGAARRATSPIGWLAAPAWWFVVATVGGVGGAALVIGLANPRLHYSFGEHTYANPSIMIGAIGVAAAVAWMIGMAIAALAVARAVRREAAWADALPFALDDHMASIGRERGEVKIEFAGKVPDRELLAQLIYGIAAPTDRIELRDPDDERPDIVTIRFDPRARATTARLMWRLIHRFVDGLLVPLHARFPIAAARF